MRGQPTGRLPWAPMMVGDYLATLPGYPPGGSPEAEEAQVRFIVDFYRVHAAGKLKFDHSVGESIRGILEDIPKSGVDGIFGYRPTCEGNASVDEVRDTWQGRVCLMGGIDSDSLARWSAERVGEMTQRSVDQFQPDDRVILSTTSAAMPGTPPENFQAVSRVAAET